MDTIYGKDGCRRLMVCMPPRHGKSEYISKYLPSWYLGKHPSKRVILTSYEASFAASWGRKARNLLEEHGHAFQQEVANSPSAADNWNISGHDGGMSTAGAGGAITGKGAHLAIIDDPIKNSEEAASEVIRNKIWEWYQSTLYTRLEPDGVLILVQTRWHEDDLAGRLIKQARSGDGEPWRILNLPAIREEGKALWPERFSIEDLMRIKKTVGDYTWESLYQGNPTPREGSFFKVNRFNFAESQPFNLKCVRAWDLAATEGDGDYSAGVKIGEDSEGRIFICDVQRGQWATDDRDRWIKFTAGTDGRQCQIRFAQDPGQAGKSQALQLVRMLAGYPVKTNVVSGDKETRADGFSSQVNGGNVWIVKGDWNQKYIEELRQFPRGKHDDQVDASSDAFNELTTKKPVWIPSN
jgi:predicted phage terminase large subunit-like protein